MGKRCPQTLTIDFAAFLVEPHKPEWHEFRRHYIQCEPCTAEVAQWAQLEGVLRSMEKNAVDAHPSVEQLAQFQRSLELLSQEDQLAIQNHLESCLACSEELACVDLFDFSRLEDAVSEADNQAVLDTTQVSQSFATRLLNGLKRLEIERIFDSLRAVFVHPAFTYAMILLLCIPTLRYYSLSTPPELTRSPDILPATRSVTPPAVRPPASNAGDVYPTDKPSTVAQAVLSQYKAAYEAQDIPALRRIWAMSSEEQGNITQLFQETRNLALLIELKEAKPNEQGEGIRVTFDQVTARLRETGEFAARPDSYTAELRKDKNSGAWMLHEVQEQSN